MTLLLFALPGVPVAHSAKVILVAISSGWLPVLLYLLGVLLVIVAALYFAKAASQLPPFSPGHEAAKTGIHQHHIKHAFLHSCSAFWR